MRVAGCASGLIFGGLEACKLPNLPVAMVSKVLNEPAIYREQSPLVPTPNLFCFTKPLTSN